MTSNYSKSEIKRTYVSLKKELGRKPRLKDWGDNIKSPSLPIVKKIFGSWNNLVKFCGVKTDNRGAKKEKVKVNISQVKIDKNFCRLKYSKEEKDWLREWNSYAYDLNFKALHELWLKYRKLIPNKKLGYLVEMHFPNIETENMFKRMQEIERYIHIENLYLRHGRLSYTKDVCEGCELLTVTKDKRNRNTKHIDAKACERAVVSLKCMHMRKIM